MILYPTVNTEIPEHSFNVYFYLIKELKTKYPNAITVNYSHNTQHNTQINFHVLNFFKTLFLEIQRSIPSAINKAPRNQRRDTT